MARTDSSQATLLLVAVALFVLVVVRHSAWNTKRHSVSTSSEEFAALERLAHGHSAMAGNRGRHSDDTDDTVRQDTVRGVERNSRVEHMRATSRDKRADYIVEMTRYAWSKYMTVAGHDEIQPVSGGPSDSWGGAGVTAYDAMDTLHLMGLTAEFNEAVRLVKNSSFAHGYSASVFETTIRHVASLLSAYTLSKDVELLQMTEALVEKLLPAFKTRTGLAKHEVNLNTGASTNNAWANGDAILSEVGSLQMELGYLSRLTGNTKYETAANKFTKLLQTALKNGYPHNDTLYKHNAHMPHEGLWPAFVDVETGRFSGAASFASLSDSFYEYLLKQWILFGKGKKNAHLRKMYNSAVDGLIQHLLRYTKTKHYAFIGQVNIGLEPTMDHLACFVPGTLILGVMHGVHNGVEGFPHTNEDVVGVATDLAATCYRAYLESDCGFAPEVFQMKEDGSYRGSDTSYKLRPELIESLFYLYRFTRDERYRDWGWEIAVAIERNCKSMYGYTSVTCAPGSASVVPQNSQESFFFAETLKYLYLLFRDEDVVPLNKYVFNTEAHAFRIQR